jgi:TonB family protein
MRNRKHDIERYLRGELSAAEMNALEKDALSDPFLAEALEGVEQAGADNFLFDLHRLNRSVHDRSRTRKNKTIRMWGWTTGIAATVLLIAVSGFLVVSLLKDQQARQLAMEEQQSFIEDTSQVDTLTVVMPAETVYAVDDKKTPKQQSSPPRVIQQKPAGEPIARPDAAEKPEQVAEAEKDTDGFLAQQAPESKKEIAGQDAEREKTKVADIPDTEALAKEDEVSRQSESAKKIKGRAAGIPASPSATGATLRSNNAVLLKGKVLSAEDGEALPGVHVIVKGTSIATDTDVNGYYEFAVPVENPKLVFSFIGFENKEVEVGDKPEINVSLNEDITSLSEVVVTSYGPADDGRTETASFRMAEPGDGRTEFKNYLNNAVKYPPEAIKNKAEGRVTVRFTVQPNGQLTDFEIVKGIGFGCDEELIRAIQQGPSWKPGKQGERPIRDQVKVRYRFELPR